ncbi:MAG TPA: agmatinase [Terriglobales bacterium]|nr:agmatinase [Terriglobales bacterium]
MPVSIVGVPFDANSSYLRGAAQAPPLIREALFSEATNLYTEMGADLGDSGSLFDTGDLQLGRSPREDFQEIESAANSFFEQDSPIIFLGGDHSITFPLLKACHRKYPEISILHFDAHPDLYPEYEGNRYSHACPFARIMENQLARGLVQIGIRSMNQVQREQVERYKVKVFPMKYGIPGVAGRPSFKLEGPVYLSFDIDVLDPAFAPGISHWEPGGMSVREAIGCLHSIEADIVAADVVEFNPTRDPSGRTAMVCAKVLKEIAGKMLA